MTDTPKYVYYRPTSGEHVGLALGPGRELNGTELIRYDVDELTDRYDIADSAIRSRRRRREAREARHRRRVTNVRRVIEAAVGLALAGYCTYLAAGGPAWPH